MKKYLLSLIIIGALLGASSAHAFNLESRVHEVVLPNGMKWLLVKRPFAPVFAGYIQVRAGGLDEPADKTGLAHMLEHMAFKGTSEIGTKDYAKEKPYMDKINAIGLKMSKEYENEAPDMVKIAGYREEIGKLYAEQKKYIVNNEVYSLLVDNGAVSVNAYTNKDVTTYYVEMPISKLEFWLYLQSQMIKDPVYREFYLERDVISEERKTSVDDDPDGALYEKLISTTFTKGPYRWPVIGSAHDILTITPEDLLAYHKKYYVGRNMVGSIVGDISIPEVTKLLNKYFDSIPAGAVNPMKNNFVEAQTKERDATIKFAADPRVALAFHKPTAPARDDYIFDLISTYICSGDDAKLTKLLVKEMKIASSVSCGSSLPGSRLDNLFVIVAQPIEPHTTKEVEKIIMDYIDSLKNGGIKEDEVKILRNRLATDLLWKAHTNNGLAENLASYEVVIGDWKYLATYLDKISKLTVADIEEVLKKYIRSENLSRVTLVRK